MPRTIMHIDMDAFFAAIEQRDRPELAGKPVIVGALPGGRGVVSTCSYEARKFGVHSAMPISEAYRRCPNGIYLRPDFTRYVEASKNVMEILDQISPVVETVSIDEAYIDITGLQRLWGTPRQIGTRTKRMIREAIDLTASVGIGPNRLVAKIASDLEKPDGLTIVPPEQVLDFLAPLSVGRLRGVGKIMKQRLEELGIHTVEQLRQWSQSDLEKRLGDKSGTGLYNQARGIGSDRIGEHQGRKSISKEVTYGEDVTDQEVLRGTLLELAAGVGRIARREGKKGSVITVKIRLRGFETHTRQKRLPHPTCSDKNIFETGWSLYRESGYRGKSIRLIGLGISGWEDEAGRQLDLLAKDDPKETQLYQAIDTLTERFGRGTIRPGGSQKKKPKD